MDYTMDSGAKRRLEGFFTQVGDVLANVKRRASFATYALGLLSEGERKSIEPIAARACASPDETDAVHQRLQGFITDSDWSDRGVRRVAGQHAISAMTKREQISTWIIDDTGFLKQGRHSVGVQRQYTGSAGKTANCQVGVSLSIATPTEHVPLDFELYLPESWANDPARRKEARIPDDVVFKTKPELALDMIRRAVEDDVPFGVLLADSGYGDSSKFREEVRWLGLDYAVGVHAPTKVWRADRFDCRRGKPISVLDLGLEIRKRGGFRRVTWREGTKTELSSFFAARRVVACHEDSWDVAEREATWLLIEWPDGEKQPTKFHLATLHPNTTKKKLVRIVKERYRTERVYEDFKGELGLDHFEGRRFRGWHHHVSVALCCYAFVVAERVQRFSPQTRRQKTADAVTRAA
jgi:SRSO17 transposase